MHIQPTRLRDLLNRPEVARAAGGHDGLTARVIEECGYDVIWASSFEISASRGLPDMSLLTMTDYLEPARQMAAATGLPVLADCDTGFGNRLNVAYMIQQYEAAGVAGVCIEDKIYPKRNSFLDGGQVLEDIAEFAAKIEVAGRSRANPDFVVVARSEALIAGLGIAEALARCHAYADAGADAILIHSKSPQPDEVVGFLAAWRRPVPVVVVPTTYYGWDIQAAAEAGVAMVIYANHGLRSSVQAMRQVLAEIRATGSSVRVEGEIASMKEIFRLTNVDSWTAVGA
jgi:phosphoenolpyruvate phosphomutase